MKKYLVRLLWPFSKMICEPLGIYKVRLPLPFRLNHVNCYAIKGILGWWLIDTGLSLEADLEGWLQFFAEHDIKPADIQGIYLTHFHPDHYGCSGRLQNYSGAPVYIGELDAERITSFCEGKSSFLDAMAELFRDNGMPDEVVKETILAADKLISYTSPHPKLTPLRAGKFVTIGDFKYQVILTPGHSDGHICFYNSDYGVLLSGDHLLTEMSSNISLRPQTNLDFNPLDNYLKALDSLRSLNCKLALPAHGKPFSNIEERITRLEAHYRARLLEISEYTASGSTAYQVCQQVYQQDLSFHELRFAMSEILAHLVYLTYQGELAVIIKDGINNYFRKPLSF